MRGTTRTLFIFLFTFLFTASCAVLWLAARWGSAPEAGSLVISRDECIPKRLPESFVLDGGQRGGVGTRVDGQELGELAVAAVEPEEQQESLVADQGTTHVQGQVLDRETLTPLHSVGEVLLLNPLAGRADVLHAQTDEEGRFECLVPYEVGMLGEYVRLIVGEANGARELHSAYLPLTSELTILVPSVELLSGVLLCDPPINFDLVSVRIDELTASGQERFLGVGEVGENGSFQVPARPREWIEEVLVSVFERDLLLASRRVPISDFSSREGCTVRVDWTRAIVSVRDEAGAPILGAEVAFGPLGSDRVWASKSSVDESGLATFPVPCGNYEYVVGASGFSPVFGETSFGEPLEVVLPRVAPELMLSGCTLIGSVEAHDGSPIDGASVFAYLETDNDELGARLPMAKALSDAEGHFELTAPVAGTYRFGAYYRQPGTWLFRTSEVSSVVLPSTREVRIVIEDFGVLAVRPTGDFLLTEGFDGSLDYLLLDTKRTDQLTGNWRSPPYELQLPVGHYVLLLRAPSLGLFGSLEYVLKAGPTNESIGVPMYLPPIASGYLVDPEGRPLEMVKVEAISRGILAKSPKAWRMDTTQGNGWYEVPVFGVLAGDEDVVLGVDLGEGDIRQVRMSLRDVKRTVLTAD